MGTSRVSALLGLAVFAGCCYEAAALVSRRRVPTISCIVRARRDEPLVAVAVTATLIGAAFHLLLDDG